MESRSVAYARRVIFSRGFILLLLSQSLSHCTDPQRNVRSQPESEAPDRPIEIPRYLTTVQLREPAVFAATAADPELLARINAEQEEFLRKIAYISPDISVVYRFRFVLNGFTLSVPDGYRSRFQRMAETSALSTEEPTPISRDPTLVEELPPLVPIWGELTSTAFIQASRVHEELHIKGEGMRIGVIDTGLDYTHKMFGGAGLPEVYASNDAGVIAEDFPTPKVIGGYDFVGADFDGGSDDPWRRTPHADPDPLDESGHGTHVAGTIAGHGDGKQTYDGVAPEASLYALKVFGKDGSTSNAVVIAALEYAADPNGDQNPDDHLDTVNLSLGSGYGVPHGIYDKALENLSRGGILPVISAGNSGNTPYIVGSPSTAAEAISVAASVDRMEQNWRKRASELLWADGTTLLIPMVANSTGPSPIGFEAKAVPLYDIGTATQDLTPEQQTGLLGKIALIARGENSFCEKGTRAASGGAIAFVVTNSDDGAPIVMGGDCQLSIPGIMISKELGVRLRNEVILGARVTLDPIRWIDDPDKIDTLASFSSRGPRSFDGLIKPEVAAPGQAIVSAAMGKGDRGVQMGGTSMAAPHITGVVALIKQKFPGISTDEVKSRLMNSAVSLLENREQKLYYPISRQGSGRVDAFAALTQGLTLQPPALSFGHVLVDSQKAVLSRVTLSNHSETDMVLKAEAHLSPELQLQERDLIHLAAGETRTISLPFTFHADVYKQETRELDGFISFIDASKVDGQQLVHLPVLAIMKRVSNVQLSSFRVYSSSSADAGGALAVLELANESQTRATVLPFLPLGHDTRKSGIVTNPARSYLCDLEDVGYRVAERSEGEGLSRFLEVGIKLYHPITSPDLCSFALLIDRDLDGIADASIFDGKYEVEEDTPQSEQQLGLWLQKKMHHALPPAPFAVPLQARAFRAELPIPEVTPQAWQGLELFDFASIAISRVPLHVTGALTQRAVAVKVIVYNNAGGTESVDVLDQLATENWWQLPLVASDQGWAGLPDRIELGPEDRISIDLEAGFGSDSLLLLTPTNSSTPSLYTEDEQSLTIKPVYGF